MNNSTIFSSVNVPGTVRRMRKDRGYTLKELAEITGFSTAKLSRLENGEVQAKRSTLERLAGVFGCGIDDFYMPSESGAKEEKEPVVDTNDKRVRRLMYCARSLNARGWRTLLTVAKALAESDECIAWHWQDIPSDEDLF